MDEALNNFFEWGSAILKNQFCPINIRNINQLTMKIFHINFCKSSPRYKKPPIFQTVFFAKTE
jgi:hypothetical protein